MKDYLWRVLENRAIAQDIYEIKLGCDDKQVFADFMPGQFLHLRAPNAKQLLLRRPISIHICDQEQGSFTLQYAVVGQGTEALSQLKAGDELLGIASVGKGFPLQNAEGESYQKIWLLGGGIGIAPLYSIVQALPNAEFDAFLGWRDLEHVYSIARWRADTKLHIYTDDGSMGEKGFAIDGLCDALKREKPDVIYACGPTPMLKNLSAKIAGKVPCFVSLEERMGCGMGACLVCNCKINQAEGSSYKRVCVDGPVFALEEVDFS